MNSKKDVLPGVTLSHGDINDLMVPFTYGCKGKCTIEDECDSAIRVAEKPVAIRGTLAGSDRCLLTTDPRWASEIVVLPPK